MIDLKIAYFLFGFFCMHQFNYLFGTGDAAVKFFSRENKFRSYTKSENEDFVEPCPTELPIELRDESTEKQKERFTNSSDQAFGARCALGPPLHDLKKMMNLTIFFRWANKCPFRKDWVKAV